MSGDDLGANGEIVCRTLLYNFVAMALVVGAVNTINVLTLLHEEPAVGVAAAVVQEGSSWFTWMLFSWVPWVAWRIAPPTVRPRWKLLIHLPAAPLFSFLHVAGFVALRSFIYWLFGSQYHYGFTAPHYLYELSKDVFGYALTIAGLTVCEYLLRQIAAASAPGETLTFDIRDGARLTRVRLDDILAIASAGNYVEFVLADGRRLMMRSPLSALEDELGPRGFLRTHRSWLVNAGQMTALKPEGSGDYEVELGCVKVPLSRRFPDALAKLRGTV